LIAFEFSNLIHKKFELMLTERAKAYSNSCSQTVSLSPVYPPKTLILAFKVFQGHRIRWQSKASVRFPISD